MKLYKGHKLNNITNDQLQFQIIVNFKVLLVLIKFKIINNNNSLWVQIRIVQNIT